MAAAVAGGVKVVYAAGVEGSAVDLVVPVACQCWLRQRSHIVFLPLVLKAGAPKSCCRPTAGDMLSEE